MTAHQAFTMRQLQFEQWMLARLNAPTLFDGDTTPEIRRERLRSHIVTNRLDHVIAGEHGGKKLTWAQVFAKAYDQPLVNGQPTQLTI